MSQSCGRGSGGVSNRGACLVDPMPCHWFCMCPCCVSALWKMFVDVCDIDEGPCAVVPSVNGC